MAWTWFGVKRLKLLVTVRRPRWATAMALRPAGRRRTAAGSAVATRLLPAWIIMIADLQPLVPHELGRARPYDGEIITTTMIIVIMLLFIGGQRRDLAYRGTASDVSQVQRVSWALAPLGPERHPVRAAVGVTAAASPLTSPGALPESPGCFCSHKTSLFS
ncbi:MAG: hypothetical protein KGL93_11225 [Gemmatimonadota bacterium]|nr:hypothetical protein [Gemmatimonadota bacterium]